MNLLADEGVDKPIVDELRSNGFNLVYILETNQRADENLFLQWQMLTKRILLTQDKDFGELVFSTKNAHHGVILIRLDGYKPHLKAEIVVNTVTKHTIEPINSFTVI